jgi:hypothetical protein
MYLFALLKDFPDTNLCNCSVPRIVLDVRVHVYKGAGDEII